MFRGGLAGGKTREEFVEEVADVFISKVTILQCNKLTVKDAVVVASRRFIP